MSRMQRLIALAVIAATLLAAASAAEAATPRAPKGFFGVMWDRAAMDGRPVDQDAQWALMRRSGVESVRMVFSWAHAQPEAGVEPDFSQIDAKVEVAARDRRRPAAGGALHARLGGAVPDAGTARRRSSPPTTPPS